MGRQRVEPGPGQESVWDYPRPPRLEDVEGKVKVVFGGVTLAYTTRAKRVLETSHPPVYYIPPEDIRTEHLRPSEGTSYCEWKGRARYYDVFTEEREESGPRGSTLTPPGLSRASRVTSRSTRPGWTGAGSGGKRSRRRRGLLRGLDHPEIVGPFKGAPGTWGW
jgi:uncharacterized protein (DUF427 family)